ncbi:uncharacterized protein LOC126745797 [Anthonomus grandis grandis]|uniref:uncharacterized protein LOC126745797 n=1 Tax=Anthonomus grandis grandis TaxID=2921223 RepID=UPI0021660873|nr:uncharacterized protein LOC126745797 [Anthonomus grandis grandis]XP_050309761.1 uncharacterized protein LOC126745797 [Anthonomus grandis grandis]
MFHMRLTDKKLKPKISRSPSLDTKNAIYVNRLNFMDIPKKTSKNHLRNTFSGKIILIVPKNCANFIGNNLKLPLILKHNAFLAIYKKSPCFPEWICLKRLFFLERLIAFNETFVPLGKHPKNNKPFAVVWHEGISKRFKKDIISTFHAFLKFNRDANNIIIWMDNCASQNKNWTLLTFLVKMIKSNEIQANKITFNYFEPGHTFMSADSFHHQIELSMKRKQKIYDFSDFLDAVGSSCKGNVDVKAMNFNDFYVWKNMTSQTKLKKYLENRPYLSDMVQVVAEHGQYTLKYKKSFTGEFYVLDFLMNKAMKKKQLHN